MSEYSDLAGKRDYSTPMHLTGKPYVKTYFDWTYYIWRTEVCILLGAREEPPGKAWGERQENRGKGRAPDRERKDASPQGQRAAVHATRPGPRPKVGTGLRARIQAHLATCVEATTSQIHATVPEFTLESVRSSLWNDPQIECLGGGKKNSESRWRLRPEAVKHEA